MPAVRKDQIIISRAFPFKQNLRHSVIFARSTQPDTSYEEEHFLQPSDHVPGAWGYR
jgi:hypothetical protein